MLQTKKQKLRFKRKKFGLSLMFVGYSLMLLSGFSYLAQLKFFPEPLISPVSKRSATSITSVLESKKIPYESVEKIEDYYLVKIKGGGDVFISDQKNLNEQVSSLQLITSRLKIEGKTFRRLDFRFENTVISF